MSDIEELRERLQQSVMDETEITLSSDDALTLWRLMGPPRRGFKVGDRVTWGSGYTSYTISHFHGEWAYMEVDSGIRIDTGEKLDYQYNEKALIVELKKA
jgi:hypothetical protein